MVPSKIKIESFAKRYHMGTLGGKGLNRTFSFIVRFVAMKFSHDILHTYCFILSIIKHNWKIRRFWVVGPRNSSQLAFKLEKKPKAANYLINYFYLVVCNRVRSFWSRSLRSGTLRSWSFGSEVKFGQFGRGHYTVPVISVVVIFVCILGTNLMLIYDHQIITNY